MKKRDKITIGYYLPSATILYYPEEGREVAGGAELNLHNLAKELAKDSAYSVSFYISDDGQKKDKKSGWCLCKKK